MLLLPRDVFANGIPLRRADRECAVSLLPRKGALTDFLMNPSRRYCFHITHNVCEAGSGAQPDQQMHMIRDPTYCLGYTIHISHHSAKVGMQPLAPRGGNTESPVFGAEHDVIME